MASTVASNASANPTRFHWSYLGQLGLDKNGHLLFPSVTAIPGIYRFTIVRDGKPYEAYVGQAKSLAARFSLYRSRGKKPSLPLSRKTTSRIACHLLQSLGRNRTVRVDVLDNETTDGNGTSTGPDLADKAIRYEAERLLITELCASGIKVLNRNGNPAWELAANQTPRSTALRGA